MTTTKPSEFSVGLLHEVVVTASKVGWMPEDFAALAHSEQKMAQVLSVVRGEKMVGEFDTIIRVDRSVQPTWPDFVKEVLHPELQSVGPAEYDLSQVELYLHDGQKDGKSMKGAKLYEHLKETDSLKNCLGFQDALEIQKKGIATFRKFFGNKVVICWKSVVRGSDGYLGVPYVYGSGGEVVVSWDWIGSDFDVYLPAARLAS